LCAGGAAGGESAPQVPLHGATGVTHGRVSSFLDPKSQAAFARTSKASREDVGLGKEEHLLDAFQKAINCKDGTSFCVVDGREVDAIVSHPQWKMIGQKIPRLFKSALKKVVVEGKILAVRGSEFPLTTGGAVEMKGEAEVLRDTKEGHDMAHPPVFGYNFIPAETLFGNTIITTYAAQGYTFWLLSDVMAGLHPKAYADKQANNRIQFQQSISARYVFGTDIGDGGELPEATGDDAVLDTLTPHVVLTTANLGVEAIRTRVGAFFAQANALARGEGIPAAIGVETPEQRKTRLAAKAKMNAVAVIDVEAVNVGDVHELRLRNPHGHTPILPEIRRLIVTTMSEGPLKIADNFLSGCSELTSLDLRSLENVTTIGNNFLSYCSGLTSLDLRSSKMSQRLGVTFSLIAGD